MLSGTPVASNTGRRLLLPGSVGAQQRGALALLGFAFAILLVAFAFVLRSHPGIMAFLARSMRVPVDITGDREGWIVRPIACGTAGLIAFFVLKFMHQGVSLVMGRGTNHLAADDLSTPTLDQFLEDARQLRIDARIAREGFTILTTMLPGEAPVEINADLRDQLEFSEPEIFSLLSDLAGLCNRSRVAVDLNSIVKVRDLLHHVESSPASKSGQFYVAATVPAPAPVAPLVDLQNASPRDSRFRTRAHFSGLKRRASDHIGPYRRATDRQPKENYTGPLRRAADKPESDPRVADRRSGERRTASPSQPVEEGREHRAAFSDASLLNPAPPLSPVQRGIGTASVAPPLPMTKETIALPASPLPLS